MTRRNRPQRPGTDEPTTTMQQRGGGTNKRKDRKPNRPNNTNKNKGGGGGGGGAKTPDAPTLNLPQSPGGGFDSDFNYGYKGDQPYYDTDDGRIDAKNNPDQYYQFLNRMSGLSADASTPFGAWLHGQGQQNFLEDLKNAQKINPQLNPIDYARSLGVPDSAADYTYNGAMSMGTGQAPQYMPETAVPQAQPTTPPATPPRRFQPIYQPGMAQQPINTGNAFTSSSGLGAVGVQPIRAQQPRFPTTPRNPLTPPTGPGRMPGLKPRPPIGTPPQTNIPGPGQQPQSGLDDWNHGQRFDFLKLSPEQRGEAPTAAAAGRWSAWG